MATAWFYKKDDKEFGPITAHELRTLAESNSLTPDDLVKTDNTDRWVPARRVSGLFQTLSIDSATTASTKKSTENNLIPAQSPQHIPSPSSESMSEPRQVTSQRGTPSNLTTDLLAPSTPKNISSITLSDLQQSALLGVLAAIPSWFFFGNILHLLAGGAIAGIAMTFTALVFGINIEDYQARLSRFIAIGVFIFLASWWLGTASIPITSVAFLGFAWIGKSCMGSDLAKSTREWAITCNYSEKLENTFKSLKNTINKYQENTGKTSEHPNGSAAGESNSSIDNRQIMRLENRSPNPVLWNPIAAFAWGIPFTCLFPALLLASNWNKLGETKRAHRCLLWLIPALLVSYSGYYFDQLLLPATATLSLLVAFGLIETKPQVKHIGNKLAGNYTARPMWAPIASSLAIILILYLSPFNYSWFDRVNNSLNKNLYACSQKTYDQIIDAIKKKDAQALATLLIANPPESLFSQQEIYNAQNPVYGHIWWVRKDKGCLWDSVGQEKEVPFPGDSFCRISAKGKNDLIEHLSVMTWYSKNASKDNDKVVDYKDLAIDKVGDTEELRMSFYFDGTETSIKSVDGRIIYVWCEEDNHDDPKNYFIVPIQRREFNPETNAYEFHERIVHRSSYKASKFYYTIYFDRDKDDKLSFEIGSQPRP